MSHPHVHDAAVAAAVEAHSQDVAELGVELRGVGLDLDAARGDVAAVGAEMEELDRGWRRVAASSTVVDDELALEVRHELEVLLLLARAVHFQLVAEQRLELLLKTENECELNFKYIMIEGRNQKNSNPGSNKILLRVQS